MRVESEEADATEPLNSQRSTLNQAERHLNESISLLCQAGRQNWLPTGLLHRSALWRMRFEISNEESEISKAERDLAEAETIAGRGSMLVWQIEAALERTRLYLALASVNSVPLRSNAGESTTEAPRTRSEWLGLAREKLAEAKRLVGQTEKLYQPHVPDWEEWKPPEYVGVFQEGEIVG